MTGRQKKKLLRLLEDVKSEDKIRSTREAERLDQLRCSMIISHLETSKLNTDRTQLVK